MALPEIRSRIESMARYYGALGGVTYAEPFLQIWLTSEVENIVAQKLWLNLGFINYPADKLINGVWVSVDFKGPGRNRVVYEYSLWKNTPL